MKTFGRKIPPEVLVIAQQLHAMGDKLKKLEDSLRQYPLTREQSRIIGQMYTTRLAIWECMPSPEELRAGYYAQTNESA